jgi:hypothetical protein
MVKLTHLERLFAALYVSEVWYAGWEVYRLGRQRRLHHKARAMVLFDRVLTERMDPEK